ncbi:MAG: hypothetical protein DSY33_00205 [Archaeoglobus sp.]|jgi:MoxR-like ATPase|nr:MAG: hypothetical protein DSY33_00205 [Archaeoglobus sp.]
MDLRDKVLKLYATVTTKMYFGEDSFFSGRESYNPLALFSILSILTSRNVLVFGDYGSGKTTSCERIASLLKCVPLEFVQASTIHGHPEQTEEKIKATLDLGALEREGIEVVRWRVTPFCPVTIVDEINRLPAGKQNLILNEVDRGIWSYRGATLFLSKKPLFATVNYGDEGTSKLIPPLSDRFDVAVETGRVDAVMRRKVRAGIDDSFLRDRELAEEMIRNVLEINGREAENYVREVAETFAEELSKRLNFEVLIPEEADEVRKEIEEVELLPEAEMFLDYLSQEVYCQMTTKKDFSRCDGCHYSIFACSDIGIFSGRAENSIVTFAKALSWLEEVECGIQQVKAVLPYCLWHRCGLNQGRVVEVRDIEKNECDEVHALKEIIEDVFRRWEEHRDFQIIAYKALLEGNKEILEELCEKISHPLFKSLLGW